MQLKNKIYVKVAVQCAQCHKHSFDAEALLDGVTRIDRIPFELDLLDLKGSYPDGWKDAVDIAKDSDYRIFIEDGIYCPDCVCQIEEA